MKFINKSFKQTKKKFYNYEISHKLEKILILLLNIIVWNISLFRSNFQSFMELLIEEYRARLCYTIMKIIIKSEFCKFHKRDMKAINSWLISVEPLDLWFQDFLSSSSQNRAKRIYSGIIENEKENLLAVIHFM